jgi:hypothetical protein
MKHCISLSLAACATVLASAAPARAQTTSTLTTPLYEVSAGYQFLNAGEVCGPEEIVDGQVVQTCSPDRRFPLGFAFDVARNFDSLGVVAEFGRSSDSEDDIDFTSWHLAGGLRYTFRNAPRVTPYGQILFGVAVDGFDAGTTDDSTGNFMMQPGGGVYFGVAERWGVFAQADLRRLFLDEDSNLDSARSDGRVFLGIRFSVR